MMPSHHREKIRRGAVPRYIIDSAIYGDDTMRKAFDAILLIHIMAMSSLVFGAS